MSASAANLRFLSFLAARSFRNLKFKSRTRFIKVASAPLLPKFVLEVAAMDDELRKRGTSRLFDLKFPTEFVADGVGTSNRRH